MSWTRLEKKGVWIGVVVCLALFAAYAVALRASTDLDAMSLRGGAFLVFAALTGHIIPVFGAMGMGRFEFARVCRVVEPPVGGEIFGLAPVTSCVNYASVAAFLVLSVVLVVLYALVGKWVASRIEKRRMPPKPLA